MHGMTSLLLLKHMLDKANDNLKEQKAQHEKKTRSFFRTA